MSGYYGQFHQQGPYQHQYAYNGAQSQPTGVALSGVLPQQGVSHAQQGHPLQNMPQQLTAYPNQGHPPRSQTLPLNTSSFVTSNAHSGFAQAPTPTYGYHPQAAYGVVGAGIPPSPATPSMMTGNAVYDPARRPLPSPAVATRPASQVFTSLPISEATAQQQQAIVHHQMTSQARIPQMPTGFATPQRSYAPNPSFAGPPSSYFPPGTPINGVSPAGFGTVAPVGAPQSALRRLEQSGRRPVSIHGYPASNGPDVSLDGPNPSMGSMDGSNGPTMASPLASVSLALSNVGNELPPVPPPKGPSSPTTAGISSGKRALPASPSLPPVPPLMTNISPAASSFGIAMPSSDLQTTRPSPIQHHSTQSLPTLNRVAGGNDPPPSSSPTKRSLPTAPGGGGIVPGTSSISHPRTASFGAPKENEHRASSEPVTSAPSSYASARSKFSSSPPVTGLDTAMPSSTPSSAPSRSPPPTGPARSTASDFGSSDDKRPLWKRMAAAATGGNTPSWGSRPKSVFGHRASPSLPEGEIINGSEDQKATSYVQSAGINPVEPLVAAESTAKSPPTPSTPTEQAISSNVTASSPSMGGSPSGSATKSSSLPKRPPLPINPSGSNAPLNIKSAIVSPTPSIPAPTRRGTSPLPIPPPAIGASITASSTPLVSQATTHEFQRQPSMPTQSKGPISDTARAPESVQGAPHSANTSTGLRLIQASSNSAAKTLQSSSFTPTQRAAPTTMQPQQIRTFTVPPEQFIPSNEPQTSFREMQRRAMGVQHGPVDHTNRSKSSSPAIPSGVPTSPPKASALPGSSGARSPPRAHGQGHVSHETRVKGFTTAYSAPLRGGSDEAPPARPYGTAVSNHTRQTTYGDTSEEDAPRVSMALHIASKSIQKQAKKDKDWAKWAMVSTNDVVKNPEPLQGVSNRAEQAKETNGSRRRSMSTGAIDLDEEPPEPIRRGALDDSVVTAPVAVSHAIRGRNVQASSNIDGAVLVNTPSGMRRGGARPMPSSHTQSDSSPAAYRNNTQHQRSRSGSGSVDDHQSFPQYRPSYTDSDSDGERGSTGTSSGPKISISSPIPQISVSHTESGGPSGASARAAPPVVAVPTINVDGLDDHVDDSPDITISIDEPQSESPRGASPVPVFSVTGPEEQQDAPVIVEPGSSTDASSKSNKPRKLKKHRREKSVKEEEDERERLRQLAKSKPLPPKIKKNSARCGKCDKIILGRIVSAMDARWHPECFK
ncbi:hypothetical protein FRC17_001014 [Serendipita sp. 399]|nr:hypothetical protein FRC17_001014 [Serendipita sp. 399]